MSPADGAMWALAALFVLAAGANDGAAVAALAGRVPGLPRGAAPLLLAAALAVVPLVLGTAVAGTLLRGVVAPEGGGVLAIALGFAAAVAVVGALTRQGLPTSLTLAVVGGITGAAAGAGLPVRWTTVALVLAVGLAAPLLGAVLGSLIARLFAHAPVLPRRAVRAGHATACLAQCAAYAANDGQKAFVPIALAAGAATGAPLAAWWYPAAAVLFLAGTLLALPRMAGALGNGVLATRPGHAVAAEGAAAAAVLGTGVLGYPVSMTQTITGALVGAGVNDGYRRVRWRAAVRVGAAWALTLPLSAAAAALLAAGAPLIGSVST
ncbi:PiT family inorganic phosphate transporter [Murinocardiopsis flavida]|uniref:PiT family inorganic phosphate transporter n=1 Tax=Murinocardiopsis flavida TaxID=645275 RepID=A0A2P8DQ49_9ACTN|nr:inorganic phosphate transporter [Murinocardiopsis flavida]PSK99318.1 PiT family inorganic phosphate transporter [Murinocardiopsis flavida]